MSSTAEKAAGSNFVVPRDGAQAAKETLRLIAQLPAPRGLEDRVIAGLRSNPRAGRLIAWPVGMQMGSNWMRTAAAAAIAVVVAGGGWGIYSHVQPAGAARMTATPPHVGASAGAGFSNAGAMRTLQTLNGPVVAKPADTQPADANAAKKTPVRTENVAHHEKAVAATKGSGRPSVTAAH